MLSVSLVTIVNGHVLCKLFRCCSSIFKLKIDVGLRDVFISPTCAFRRLSFSMIAEIAGSLAPLRAAGQCSSRWANHVCP